MRVVLCHEHICSRSVVAEICGVQHKKSETCALLAAGLCVGPRVIPDTIASGSESILYASARFLCHSSLAGALERAGIDPSVVDEVFMGNVISSNLGQVRHRGRPV